MGEAPEHWVFAYGSLMWDPGFAVVERVLADVQGFARRFCLRSVVYRGTVDAPGLVLGLDIDPAAACRGLALRVADADWPDTLAGLRERELTTEAYAELLVPLHLTDGRTVEAVAYVIRRDHDQYWADLPLAQQAHIIAHAHGGRGPNTDYLFNTAAHLKAIGVEDPEMQELTRLVRELER